MELCLLLLPPELECLLPRLFLELVLFLCDWGVSPRHLWSMWNLNYRDVGVHGVGEFKRVASFGDTLVEQAFAEFGHLVLAFTLFQLSIRGFIIND